MTARSSDDFWKNFDLVKNGKKIWSSEIRSTDPSLIINRPILIWFLFRRNTFGSCVIDATTGRIDRDALRQIILEDCDARKRLNQITHPRIRRRMAFQIIGHFLMGNQYAVLDVPLLYETSGWILTILHKVTDSIVSITVDWNQTNFMSIKT